MLSFAGSFLVARPVLKDPSFSQTVVLLLQHDEEGAFGLVVNRLSAVEELPFPVYTGGPCGSDGFLMLHGHSEWLDFSGPPDKTEVAPGVFLGDVSCLNQVTDPVLGPASRFRMFSGYAGWAPDQLEGELASGAWAAVPATSELLFDTPAEELWDRLAPPAIPLPSLN